MQKVLLAADLGGTNLRIAEVTKRGEILSRAQSATPTSRTLEAITASICEAVGELRQNSELEPAGLSLALPGTIDAEHGVVSKSPNLPALDGFPIVRHLGAELGFPVLIENDANAAAVGESWIGSSKGTSTSIIITLGTGVGGGIIVDKKLIRGLDGTAGEIGHIVVEPEGLPCGCGGFGCVEQYASATAISRMARERSAGPGEIDRTKEHSPDSKTVFSHAVDGKEWAIKIFETQGYYLGIVLSGLINCLNPEAIVIGGGASAGWEMFIYALREEVGKRAYPVPAARARILRSTLGDNAGILGAARLAFEGKLVEADTVV